MKIIDVDMNLSTDNEIHVITEPPFNEDSRRMFEQRSTGTLKHLEYKIKDGKLLIYNALALGETSFQRDLIATLKEIGENLEYEKKIKAQETPPSRKHVKDIARRLGVEPK